MQGLAWKPPLPSRLPLLDTSSAPSAQDAFRLQGRVPHPALSDLLREEEDLKRRDTPSLPYISGIDITEAETLRAAYITYTTYAQS